MLKKKHPVTPAIRLLRSHGLDYTPHLYPYAAKGGTRHAANILDLDEHHVIKTLVMEKVKREPFLVLMHGDCEVSEKTLARSLGVKTVSPCDPATAQRYTGYQVGGTSPFGTRQSIPVYLEASILQLDKIYINGGKRGFLIEIPPQSLMELLDATPITAALQGSVSER